MCDWRPKEVTKAWRWRRPYCLTYFYICHAWTWGVVGGMLAYVRLYGILHHLFVCQSRVTIVPRRWPMVIAYCKNKTIFSIWERRQTKLAPNIVLSYLLSFYHFTMLMTTFIIKRKQISVRYTCVLLELFSMHPLPVR